MQKSKQEVTKVVLLVKNGRKSNKYIQTSNAVTSSIKISLLSFRTSSCQNATAGTDPGLGGRGREGRGGGGGGGGGGGRFRRTPV